jgi:cobalt-zinc-cadmium efflux system membrane fusion protein
MQPLALEDARLRVWLERFGGRRDSVAFRNVGDFLQGVKTVAEPHSYTARVVLERGGQRNEWTFEQEEGRLELAPEAVEASGIRTGTAGPHEIEVRVDAPGEVRLNAERVVQIRPRFAGLVRSLDKSQGDRVRAGERLAVVHSNESLADYEITAPMAGTVVARDVVAGQNVGPESVLYTVADLSTVWVDLALYPQISGRVRRGQMAHIRTEAGDPYEATAPITYVGPLLEQDTRVSYGRVVLANAGNRWQPGLFVAASITLERVRAKVAVPEAAIVRSRMGPAVFRAVGSSFELQPVTVGQSDGTWTEILEGLEAGATIVVAEAYLLKAELGKSEATHDH